MVTTSQKQRVVSMNITPLLTHTLVTLPLCLLFMFRLRTTPSRTFYTRASRHTIAYRVTSTAQFGWSYQATDMDFVDYTCNRRVLRCSCVSIVQCKWCKAATGALLICLWCSNTQSSNCLLFHLIVFPERIIIFRKRATVTSYNVPH